MEHKSFQSFVKEISGRTVTGIASVFGILDDGGDIIEKGAYKKTIAENLSRIKFLWRHDWTDPPVATINELKEISKRSLPKELLEKFPEASGGLEVTRTYLETPRGDEVLKGIEANPAAINEMSIGYDPIKVAYEDDESKQRIRRLKEVKLWDVSDVPWGMNPATMASKALVPFKATPPAPLETTWDAGAQVKKAEVADLKIMATWYDEGNSDSKGSYKLPHHEAGEKYRVVWKGVAAAMGALLGARGGVDIPEADRKPVYNHLVKHYKQFDKEPPDFKLIELIHNIKDVREAGGVPKGLLSAMDALNNTICELTAEPAKQPLTDPTAMKLRLELAEREFGLQLLWEVA